MEIPYKKLTGTAIDSSSYIQKWLSQFCESDKVTAIQILKHLHFIPRDSFSLWLNDSLDHLDKNEKYALYAVRKFLYNKRIFWNSKGYPPTKPSQGQGSEDFISSLINEASRRQNDIFFDHPSIDVIQQQKIKTIILIDDATGSGSRLISYIKFMLTSQKLLSYLSLGRIRFKIFVFASNNVAEQNITKNLFRHQSRQRKVSFSEKFIFIAKYKYDVNDYASRWGNDWKKIIQLVDKTTKVTPKNERRGYGEVMSNIVFYHSVPNNIPKLLLGKTKKWQGVISVTSKRVLSDSILKLLKNMPLHVPDTAVEILRLYAVGAFSDDIACRKFNLQKTQVNMFIELLFSLRFLKKNRTISQRGIAFLNNNSKVKSIDEYDRSLYIPTKWCVD